MQFTLKVVLLTFCLSNIAHGQIEKTEVYSKIKDYSVSKSYRPKRTYIPKLKRKKRKKKDKEIVKVVSNSEQTSVRIPIIAYDKSGTYIDDLKFDEIQIYENGVKQQITNFGVSDDPLNIILLLDTSPSTDILQGELRKAARNLVKTIDQKHNVRVAKFSRNLRFISKKNNSRKSLMDAIDKIDFKSGTSIYDTVQMFESKIVNDLKGQTIVIVFSDGVDTSSRKFDYETSIKKAENSNVVYFGIYFNTYFANTMRQGYRTTRKGLGLTEWEYGLGYQYLNELVASTGGTFLDLKRDVDKIKPAFELVNKMINQQNFIEYTSKSNKIGRKEIKVQINRPDLLIRTRDNYYIGN